MKLEAFSLVLISLVISQPTFAKKTIIEYWTTTTQADRIKVIDTMVEKFESINPSIDVHVIAVDENDISSQIESAAASDTLPEIVEVGSNLSLAFAEQNLVDLAANTEVIKTVGEPHFYQGALKMVEAANTTQYVALPYRGWIQGIWYRADWFQQAGLKPPETWENIIEAAEYFYKPEQHQYGILIGTHADSYAEQVYTQFALSNDAGEFDSNGNLVFNSTQQKEVLDFYKKLAAYTPPGPQTWRARDYYLQGKLAMFFYSTHIMDDISLASVASSSLSSNHFKELEGAEFDPNLANNTRLATTITRTSPSSFGTIVGFSIMKNRDKRKTQATKQFLLFMNKPEQVVSYSHMAPGGHLPMLKYITESDSFYNDPKGVYKRYGKESIKEIISGFENIKNFSVVDGKVYPQSGEIFSKKIIPKMIYKVVIEEQDSQQLLNWAEKQMQQVTAN